MYNRYLKAVPLRRVLGWTCLAGTASGATQLILVTGVVHWQMGEWTPLAADCKYAARVAHANAQHMHAPLRGTRHMHHTAILGG